MTNFFARVLLCATAIVCGSCFNPDDYDNVDASEILHFISPDTIVQGDGVSEASIRIKLAEEASFNRRIVTFKTTSGSFAGGKGDSVTVEAGLDFIAVAKLMNTRAGKANVTAKAYNVETEDIRVVEFTKAYPLSISVTVDSFAIFITFKSETLITAKLSTANGGAPSSGHPVTFKVTDLADHPIGFFLNDNPSSKTNAEGKATIRFSAGDAAYTGYLLVTATTIVDVNNTPVNATTKIYLSN